MKEKLLSNEEIEEWIKFEANCGCNDLLQQLFNPDNKGKSVYAQINEKNEFEGVVVK